MRCVPRPRDKPQNPNATIGDNGLRWSKDYQERNVTKDALTSSGSRVIFSLMKRSLLTVLLCALAGPASSQDQVLVDDQPAEEVRQVEVIKIAGHKKPAAELDEDDEMHEVEHIRGKGLPHDRGGPMRGMRRMMITKERHHEADPAMKERFLKVREAEEKVRAMKRKLVGAKDAEKAGLKAEAKAALGELFDARLAMDQAALERMEEKIAERRAKLAKKKAAREKLIDEKAEEISGDDPGWDD